MCLFSSTGPGLLLWLGKARPFEDKKGYSLPRPLHAKPGPVVSARPRNTQPPGCRLVQWTDVVGSGWFSWAGFERMHHLAQEAARVRAREGAGVGATRPMASLPACGVVTCIERGVGI